MEGLIVFIWIFIIIAYVLIITGLCNYAKRLGQENGIPIFLGIFFTPLIAFFYLYMLGETDAHRKARIQEEEKWKRDAFEDQTKENNESSNKNVTDVLNL